MLEVPPEKRGNLIFFMKRDHTESKASDILSSLSPVITLDSSQIIRFSNESFRHVFRLENPEGMNFFDILKVSEPEKQNFLRNLQKSRRQKVENSEFIYKKKVYGYSVFRVKNEYAVILKDITEIRSLEARVKNLHSRLLDIQEKERQYIASELHDSVGQSILAAKLNFTNYFQNPRKNRDRFIAGMELIDLVSQEIRDLYTSLYPSTLKDLGLEATVRWYARNFLDLKKIRTDIRIELKSSPSDKIQISLFRVFQELISNIVKHSGADYVSIELFTTPQKVILKVKDNGKGFEKKSDSQPGQNYGLENIMTRVSDLGGTVKTVTAKGKGASFSIEVPL